jgi:hypothetical protein
MQLPFSLTATALLAEKSALIPLIFTKPSKTFYMAIKKVLRSLPARNA